MDQDVGRGEEGQHPVLGRDDDGVGGVQGLVGVQVDVHLDHHHLAGHAGAQLMHAEDLRIGQDGLGDGDTVGLGHGAVQQVVGGGFQHAGRAPEQPDGDDDAGRCVQTRRAQKGARDHPDQDHDVCG